MKIFGIGLSRTGTTSLSEALRILGYDSSHWPLSPADLEEHEAATDITVSCRFQELDRRFPGSKFIYTTRDLTSWLPSCRAHWGYLERSRGTLALPAFAIEAEMILFGTLTFDEVRFAEAYDRHHRSVASYFENRKSDLLVMNIAAGHGWPELCQFLGEEIPGVRFPRLNFGPPAVQIRKSLISTRDRLPDRGFTE
jgi:hypothetical protein